MRSTAARFGVLAVGSAMALASVVALLMRVGWDGAGPLLALAASLLGVGFVEGADWKARGSRARLELDRHAFLRGMADEYPARATRSVPPPDLPLPRSRGRA